MSWRDWRRISVVTSLLGIIGGYDMTISLSSFMDNLHVVIVGSSGGVGQSLVKHLLGHEQVTSVIGWSRCSSDIKHPRFKYCSMDYNNEESIRIAADAIIEPIDMVIVATGFLHDENILPEKSFKQLSGDAMMKYLLLNTVGPSLVAKHLLPKMRMQRKSVFTVLSARVGSISDNRLGGWYAYRASKAALNMMIKTLAVELKRCQKNVIVAGLHPGTVDTYLSKPFQRSVKPEQLFTSEFSARCLLNVINQLKDHNSGYCFAWDGKKIPE